MHKATLSQQLTALGDKTRYAIVASTIKGESLCVSELASRLHVTPAAISQHMKLLERAGVIIPARNGRRVCYEINPESASVQTIAKLIKKEEEV